MDPSNTCSWRKKCAEGQAVLLDKQRCDPKPGFGIVLLGRNGAPPNPDLFPTNNPVLQPPISEGIGLWAKTDSTSYYQRFAKMRVGQIPPSPPAIKDTAIYRVTS
jgi:hypothetical protein